MTLEQFSRLVTEIYAAAVDASRWSSTLSDLLGAVGGSNGALVIADSRARTLSAVSVGVAPAAVEEYNAYYGRLDPVAAALERAPVGSVLSQSMIISPREQARGEFFNDWVYRYELGVGTVSAPLLREPDTAASIVLGVSRRQRDTDRLGLLRLFVPHLQQALRVHTRVGGLALDREEALQALDSLPYGIVIGSSGNRPLFANRAALEIAALNDGLALESVRLRATPRYANAALESLVARASAHGKPPSGGSLRIERPSGRRAFLLVVVPLVRPVAERLRQSPGVLIVIVDPDCRPQLSTATLQQLFDLTPAEAAVAVRVMEGRGLQAVADELAVTLSTVRIHLQRVFEKTGTHRQAELVRLLADLCVACSPRRAARGGSGGEHRGR